MKNPCSRGGRDSNEFWIAPDSVCGSAPIQCHTACLGQLGRNSHLPTHARPMGWRLSLPFRLGSARIGGFPVRSRLRGFQTRASSAVRDCAPVASRRDPQLPASHDACVGVRLPRRD